LGRPTSRLNGPRHRRIEPATGLSLRFSLRQPALFCCQQHGRAGTRLSTFCLINIEKVEITESSFQRRKKFLLRAFAERSFGVFQEKPFHVVWRFSPKAAADVRQFLFNSTQTFEDQPDGSLIARFRAGGALEMCCHLPFGAITIELR
jgi:hypothetical protein